MKTLSPKRAAVPYAFIQSGRQVPLSNVWIYGPQPPRRVDHLIERYGIILEGDGAVKYNDRPDAAAIVSDEKERHRYLQRLGFSVIRYTDAIARHQPDRILADVDREIHLRRGRPAPTCWSFDPPWALSA